MTQGYTAITQFKVIQGHRFLYQSKARMRLPISEWWLILTFHISCTVSKLWPIDGHIFAIDMGVPHFNALAGGDPLRISRWTLSLQKLEGLFYQMLKTAGSYVHSSGQNTGMWRTDRWTDRYPLAGTAVCIVSNVDVL